MLRARTEPTVHKEVKRMNQYEVLYVIDASLDDEAVHAAVEKFKGIAESNGAEVSAVDEWGKRKLAYAINYKTEGYYVLMTFSSAPEFPKELERNMRNDEQIIRYMVTRKEA